MARTDASFGVRLRAARAKAGLSQADLERLCGVPKTRLSRYENDHILPSLGTLRKIAAALSVSEANLLGTRVGSAEEFLGVLEDRGITFASPEQGARMANAVADLVEEERSQERPAG